MNRSVNNIEITAQSFKLLFTTIILLSLFTNLSASEPDKKRPNILYIFTDDQSVRTVSSYPEAQPWVKTPNIDRLAQLGVQFRYCYTGAKCVPSRGNALTGMLQHNYNRDTPFWPVEFRKQGYYTGMIGKWHWDVPRHDETWDWSQFGNIIFRKIIRTITEIRVSE